MTTHTPRRTVNQRGQTASIAVLRDAIKRALNRSVLEQAYDAGTGARKDQVRMENSLMDDLGAESLVLSMAVFVHLIQRKLDDRATRAQ